MRPQSGAEAAVLDLRSLVPLDRETLLRVARHCGIVHDDTRPGSIGKSLAAKIQEEVDQKHRQSDARIEPGRHATTTAFSFRMAIVTPRPPPFDS